jgi:hypothetical protein
MLISQKMNESTYYEISDRGLEYMRIFGKIREARI